MISKKNNSFYFICLVLLPVVACHNEKAEENPREPTIGPDSEKQLKDAVAAFPDSFLLKENLIQYYTDKANYPAALGEINSALSKDSSNARLWEIRGTVHFENADTVNAIRDFEQAIKIQPAAEYMIALGTMYAQTKNKLALAIANELSANNNSNPNDQAFFIEGLYYNFTNEKNKAIVALDKCLAQNHTFMDAYREKSIALYDLGKYDESLAVLDKALTLQNNYDEGYYYSGRCLEKLNRIPEAIQSYQNAVKLSPDYIEAKEALDSLKGNK